MADPAVLRLVADVVAPMGGAAGVHAPGFVDVADGRIAAVGDLSAAPVLPDGATVERIGGLLLPGFLNGHAHSPMTVLRGAGEGLPLDRWLREVIWPREGRLTPDDVRTGMALGGAEMLLNGITTSSEMYYYPEAVAEGAVSVGIRSIVAVAVVTGLDRFGTPDGQLAGAVELRNRMAGQPLVEVALGPHSAYMLDDAVLGAVRDTALANEMLVHIHVAETRDEGDAVEERTGRTVPSHLDDLGMLETRMVAAHGVWLTAGDIDLFARHGVGVAHCPGSNGKLASGIAPVRAMRAAGSAVAVSTDGPASNDNLDVVEEARLALLYARLREHDASALGTGEALRMITSEAAAALGRDDLGALEAGRRADIVRFSLERPEYGPVTDPSEIPAHLIWAGSARDVTDVWVEGRRVVADGEALLVDVAALQAEAASIAQRIAG
jgi:5-methylthioadenosine/S-adenosylhomocysteine deaminase